MSQTVQVEDALSREKQKAQPLYAGRVQVYPKRVSGLFRRLKWTALTVLLGIYYLVPWIRWDRGPNAPDQAVLIDLPSRRAYFFFIEIWPHEVYYFTGLLVLGAIGIFLATSLVGRVWCGYACPQTVWTDLYMWVERRVEGDRNTRIKLDKAPLSAEKALRKTLKHGIWLLIAVLTGGAWIMYFNDAPSVVPAVLTGQASMTVYFFVGLFTTTTYLLAGWAREQVCTFMCPWPRFQAAMFDEDTLIVTYQRWRGEPRSRHRKGLAGEGLGDCVDCNLCVAVCPTGIDIRDGQQLECISCALCIDACNSVMGKVGLPGDLINYDTVRRQDNRARGETLAYRLLRPRTILYGVVFALVGGLMLLQLITRPNFDFNVLHDRNPLFVTLSDGSIRNGYTIKVLNMSREERRFSLEARALESAALQVVGQEGDAYESLELIAKPDGVATYKVYLALPRAAAGGETRPFDFVLTDLANGETAETDTMFRGPKR
jgi:cytochrome c oxidase accessory protein FixG